MELVELLAVLDFALFLVLVICVVVAAVVRLRLRAGSTQAATAYEEAEPDIGLHYIDGAAVRCPVCLQEISNARHPVNTPCCQSPCHREHLLEFVRVQGKCPYCGSRLGVQNGTVVEAEETVGWRNSF